MGSNRRYAASIDARMDDRILERLASRGTLQSLTAEELGLDRAPVTTDPRPARVRAWVRFGPEPAIVEAELCMWTDRAAAIRFRIGGRERRCWVWSGAIVREDDHRSPGPVDNPAGLRRSAPG
ncbi:hypothetical protein KZX37_12720 [Microbacterium sp. EYE_5]|uniref:hypothetical protein n=2 Tax=Microbacterium TaxID=33882 RepID=UPI002002AB11|nr:hypothetical protein [Microbacterium sp. EYE_5]MCK6219158.1 hypothetical protein [Microbacterium sp. EYE_5]